MRDVRRVVVIGGGVGGLTAAAVLARAGLQVTVLEAHVYTGGSAGTFFHQGYRFDAGATLAGGFYTGGPMDRAAQAAGVPEWPARPDGTAMQVHLPDGCRVTLRSGPSRWPERRDAFGPAGVNFYLWQERTAGDLWDLALRLPPWPPQTPGQLIRLAAAGAGWLAEAPAQRLRLGLLADAFRPVAAHLRNAPERLRLFVDAQLLISAQVTSDRANALYGAAALDLPRRGVVHLEGGMGAIAETLAQALRRHGGQVLKRHTATRIAFSGHRPVAVETRGGESFPADLVIANLPPWNLAGLLGEAANGRIRNLPAKPRDGWGAFTVYVGLDGGAVPAGMPLHHQVVVGRPLGEGNSVFLSLSPAWDLARAPEGRRALTLSTHTGLDAWWGLFERDRPAYEARRTAYTEKALSAAERVIPGLRQAADLILPGTPVTFRRFTRRAWGWVGGFPQTGLARAWGPRLGEGLWMVGDSIFPGQSTAAVALGGLRVANEILRGI